MMNKSEDVYLLGGLDAEMLAIRWLLDVCKKKYVDKALSWENSFLSKYQEDYSQKNETKNYIALELKDDLKEDKTFNVVHLDHHGYLIRTNQIFFSRDRSGSYATLIQVAMRIMGLKDGPQKHDLDSYQKFLMPILDGFFPRMWDSSQLKEENQATREKLFSNVSLNFEDKSTNLEKENPLQLKKEIAMRLSSIALEDESAIFGFQVHEAPNMDDPAPFTPWAFIKYFKANDQKSFSTPPSKANGQSNGGAYSRLSFPFITVCKTQQQMNSQNDLRIKSLRSSVENSAKYPWGVFWYSRPPDHPVSIAYYGHHLDYWLGPLLRQQNFRGGADFQIWWNRHPKGGQLAEGYLGASGLVASELEEIFPWIKGVNHDPK